jgi:hypothetical protein
MYSCSVVAGEPGPTASAIWKLAASETGAKSLIGSYLSLVCVSGAKTVTAIGEIMRVRPSGAAFFSASAASWPLAPGLFSTTTDVPSEVLIRSTMSRAMTSDVPPGGKPIKIRTGPSYAPAAAVMARPRTASSARSFRRQSVAL